MFSNNNNPNQQFNPCSQYEQGSDKQAICFLKQISEELEKVCEKESSFMPKKIIKFMKNQTDKFQTKLEAEEEKSKV